jgi:hypothetical protein
MKNIKNNIYSKESKHDFMRNIITAIKCSCLSFLLLGLTACSDFVEIDPPKNTLVTETVFKDAATAESALANIYYKMREAGMVSGNFGLGILMGSYTDELDYYSSNVNFLKIYGHNVINTDATALGWWSEAYNLIYAANDIINGVDNSDALSLEDQMRFKGQALFIRGFMHSLLVMIYGDIPYITTTDYLENNTVARIPVNSVYDYIITDLNEALSLLNDTDSSGEHVIPNRSAVLALLARIYIYTESWELADEMATEVISKFNLEPNISKVFLKNSPETIWQFKPGVYPQNNSLEAQWLIIRQIPGQSYAITDSLLAAFETGDLRLLNWIGSFTSTNGLTTLNYAYKYKQTFNTTTSSLEYSIIFRLAEQYLIRAEARAHLGNISGAQQDLNVIRNRAGLADTTASTMDDLLEAMLQERRVELFTEQGHRWFDLKRLGIASEVLSPIKSNWKDTDVLFPIPANEIELNPNLKPQNTGY